MGSSAIRIDNIPAIAKTSATTLQLATTNAGRPTRVTVGGQSYTISSPLTITVTTQGVNGLDNAATPGFGNTWYVYAIVNQSSLAMALVASLSASGPTVMPSGYGTAYKLIGAFNSSDSVSNTIAAAWGLYPSLPGINSTGSGFDPVLGWVFGGPTGSNSSLSAVSIVATQMTGGQNVIDVLGSYSPTLIGRYSAGTTLLATNVRSSAIGSEQYSKKVAAFGSSMMAMGITDAGLAFEWRYGSQATSSPQSTYTAMWPTALMSLSTSGDLTVANRVLPLGGLAGNYTEKGFYVVAKGITNNSFNWTFQDTGGTSNSNMWAALVSIQMFGDATNSGQYLYWIACFGNTQIYPIALASQLPTGAGSQALSITRPSSNVINFSTNNNGAIKTIEVLFECRS